MIDFENLRKELMAFREEDRHGIEKMLELIQSFQNKFSYDMVENMDIDEYILGKDSKETYLYWLKCQTERLGEIGEDSVHKYGIYFSKEENEYKVSNKFKSSSIELSFEKIRKSILEIIELDFSKNDYKECILKNPLSTLVKFKSLYLYHPDRFMAIFRSKLLKEIIDILKIEVSENPSKSEEEKILYFQRKLIDFKNSNEPLRELHMQQYCFFLLYLQDHDKNPIYPNKVEYDPHISNEMWFEMLNDPGIFDDSSLEVVKKIKYMGGRATCTELAEKYGKDIDFYKNTSTSLGKRIAQMKDIPTYESGGPNYWAIPYLGRSVKGDKSRKGSYEYILREELDKALEELELSTEIDYWTYSPGKNSIKWEEFLDKNIIGLEKCELGDLNNYKSKEEIQSKMVEIFGDGSYTNDALCYWQFSHEMKVGDVIFAKKGKNILLGKGIVRGEYFFQGNNKDYTHLRKVEWIKFGNWESADFHATKTLTKISQYKEYVNSLNDLVEGSTNYYWLNANPKIWSFSDIGVLEEQVYTNKNENGNKRKIAENFERAKKGDKLICYESNPIKKIVALGEVTSNDGALLGIKKMEDLVEPLDFSFIKDTPGLESMEFFINPMGTLFKLTPKEYNILNALIRQFNPEGGEEENPIIVNKPNYSREDFLEEVFFQEERLDELIALLNHKKNIILQGPPGVGKTYIAKKLAYIIMGKIDSSHIEFVQFHQNYSYEDFVIGYKPSDRGFALEEGIFTTFIKKALFNKKEPYFFIIDEINRGNMSKIFGELLMGIEKQYRDQKIRLPYKERTLIIPNNLYIIGMMNTADRSLAMIDYALRRRFAFFPLEPIFNLEPFIEYSKSVESKLFEESIRGIQRVNKKIENDPSLGKEFCIGHSYFCGLKNSGDLEKNLYNILKFEILPTLKEYWFDDLDEFETSLELLGLKNDQ